MCRVKVFRIEAILLFVDMQVYTCLREHECVHALGVGLEAVLIVQEDSETHTPFCMCSRCWHHPFLKGSADPLV